MKTFIEITSDKGYAKSVAASNNGAEYIIASAKMHDLYNDYVERYNRIPTAAWYRRHAQFEEKN